MYLEKGQPTLAIKDAPANYDTQTSHLNPILFMF